MNQGRSETVQTLVARAIEGARAAGAAQADAVLVRSDSREVKVRGEEIEFVKQADERCLGIRTLVAQEAGLSTAVTSTCDLAEEAIDRMAVESVALAKATAPDPHAGLPEDGFAKDPPDLDLIDEGDRNATVEARIEDARSAEAAASCRLIHAPTCRVSAHGALAPSQDQSATARVAKSRPCPTS